MAHPQQVPDIALLRKRANYFFSSRARSRAEVADFAHRLAQFGDVAVIGGMLRDLYLNGNRDFTSDIDFVVQAPSISDFERFMAPFAPKANRFGGYGLTLNRWRVDVWPLERTWAFVAGHVPVKSLEDLLRVTFFDWDAIIYRLRDQKIVAYPNYFDRVNRRVLDINLEPNPNPLGNAVRALRYSWKWRAALGPRLAQHVHSQIEQHGWGALVAADRLSHARRILEHIDGLRLGSRLRALDMQGWSEPAALDLRPEQRKFDLDS